MKLDQVGFLTIAQNTNQTNYLDLAYLQAMSIKLVMPEYSYAVIVDKFTANLIENKHLNYFNHVIELEKDCSESDSNKFENEWQIFNLSPFKETIKLESDILITRSIAHWINTFRLRDIVLSLGCKNYMGDKASSRQYRKFFDDNLLPDIYNGLMYFRYSKTAFDFFQLAEKIFSNWKYIYANVLKNCRQQYVSTDVVYALAAQILGIEQCTIPSADFINFVHMKPAINEWPNQPWHEIVSVELDLPMIRIANVNQYYPLHYHEKSFINDSILKEYENVLARRINESGTTNLQSP